MGRKGVRILLAMFCFLLSGWAHAQYEQVKISATYTDRPVAEILRDIHRTYDVRMAYDTKALREIKGTFSFQNIALNAALDDICNLAHCTHQLVGGTVVIVPVVVVEPEVQTLVHADISVRGVVRDKETGEPLPYATVVMRGSRIGASANEDGRFVLLHVPSDTTRLEVSYLGFESKTFRIPEQHVDDKLLVFALEPKRTFLPAAVILAPAVAPLESSDIAGIQSINPTAFPIASSSGEADVMRAAQLLPGVVGTNENSGGLNVRGSDADQSLISFDGFTLYHLDHFFGVYSSINANAVKNMRIRKGALDAKYGGRIGGVVEVTGKEGNVYRTSGTLDLGPIAAGILLESPIGKKQNASVLIAARRSFTDAFYSPNYKTLFNNVYNSNLYSLSDSTKNSFSAQTPDFYFHDITAKVTYRPTERDVLNLSLYEGEDKLSLTLADTTATTRFNYNNNDKNAWSNVGTGFRWGRNWTDQWSSLVNLGWSRYKSSSFAQDSTFDKFFQSGSAYSSSDLTELFDFNVRAEVKRTWQNNTLTGGLHVNSIRTSRHFASSATNTAADSLSMTGAISAAYAQFDGRKANLKYGVGLRMNYFDITSKIYPEARGYASWQVAENWTIKMAANRVYQFVHRLRQRSLLQNQADQWLLSDGVQLPVLRSDQVSLGFVWKKKQWTIDLDSYLKFNEGTFEYLGVFNGKVDAVSASNTYDIATGHGRVKGVDFLVQHHFKTQTAWIGYSYLKAENQFSLLDNAWIPESYDQRHEVKLYYEKTWHKWQLSCLFIYGSGKPYTPLLGVYNMNLINGTSVQLPFYAQLNQGRLPAYHRLDVSASRTIQWTNASLKLEMSVFNVYNRNNLRDIQYLTFATQAQSYSILQKNISMVGFMPSINLHLTF